MIAFAADALACHRLTRLVTSDSITAPLRDGIIRESYAMRGDREARTLVPTQLVDWTERAKDDGPDAPFFARLISCSACASVWCAAFIVVARTLAPKAWNPLARLLACSSVAILATAYTTGRTNAAGILRADVDD